MIWIDGEEKIEIEIGKIANQRDMSKIEPSKRPLLNPSLELSGIYFMQELRRPVKQEEHKNIRELEEELIANLRKAEFLIAINAEQEEDGKLHIPYLKNKEDKIMQPVFTAVSYTHLDVYKRQGAVVGATYPEMGKVLRKIMPKTFILVPGYGAQGGKGADLVHFFNEDGLGAIVNSSRGIIAAYKQEKYKEFGAENYADASRAAVKDMIADISGALENR